LSTGAQATTSPMQQTYQPSETKEPASEAVPTEVSSTTESSVAVHAMMAEGATRQTADITSAPTGRIERSVLPHNVLALLSRTFLR
jgi:hypothetical protein